MAQRSSYTRCVPCHLHEDACCQQPFVYPPWQVGQTPPAAPPVQPGDEEDEPGGKGRKLTSAQERQAGKRRLSPPIRCEPMGGGDDSTEEEDTDGGHADGKVAVTYIRGPPVPPAAAPAPAPPAKKAKNPRKGWGEGANANAPAAPAHPAPAPAKRGLTGQEGQGGKMQKVIIIA